MKLEAFLLGLMDKQLKKSDETLVFLKYDNCSETSVCSKLKNCTYTYYRRMDG